MKEETSPMFAFAVMLLSKKKKFSTLTFYLNLENFVPEMYLLIPMSLMAVAGGPMKMIPSLSQSSANSTFSDKNPYPG